MTKAWTTRWRWAALLALPLLLPGHGGAQAAGTRQPAAAAEAGELESRRQALLHVEDEWLRARDAATLERILGDDFVHPVPQGYFLSKAEHIAWVVEHPPQAGLDQRFEGLRVRIYDAVGIVTGEVVTSLAGGQVRRSVFTDVFVWRDGRWQAVNGQENAVEASPRRAA
ncbi:MAG TPA: nuclear transport factor 2 family protein [Thermoanaerobaculia bacterium]|nr:nuclear transport factor 2 family protein [Thermoanaerobaculia bacterium]